jgi:hypothetical protein
MTILTAYISALTMSNQAFAQQDEKGNTGSAKQTPIHVLGKILGDPAQRNLLAGQEAHVGQVLGGIHTTIHNILGGSTSRLGCGKTPGNLPYSTC